MATAPNHVREQIRSAIEQLGGVVDMPPLPPPGTSMIGWYMKPKDRWHEIVDEVDRDGGRQFLSACRRWNSEGWVTRDDRQIVQAPAHGTGGIHCEHDQYTGSSSWSATRALLGDKGPYIFLKADVVWHIAHGDDTVQTREARSVYLTVCGRWIDQSQARTVLHGRPVSRVCDDCATFAEGPEPTTL